MKNQLIEQVLDKSSYGIYEYANQLNKQINSTVGFEGHIKNFNEPLVGDSIKIFHYSNSTRRILLRLIKEKDSKIITIIHDIIPRNKIIKKINWLFMRIIKNKCNKIIVHSKFAKNLIIKEYSFMKEKNIIIIPHGTFIHNINKNEKEKIRTLYKIDKSATVFLSLGAITKKRGQIKLIRELNKIKNENYVFLIVGKCTDNNFIKELRNNKNMKYYGFVNNNEIENFFQISDAMIIYRESSVGESSGAISYAIGHGIPIIASDVGSFKESIGNAGIIFKNKNIRNINKAIQRFIQNKNIIRNNTKNLAKKITWERYLWKITTQ